jgi:hypothetical protein
LIHFYGLFFNNLEQQFINFTISPKPAKSITEEKEKRLADLGKAFRCKKSAASN